MSHKRICSLFVLLIAPAYAEETQVVFSQKTTIPTDLKPSGVNTTPVSPDRTIVLIRKFVSQGSALSSSGNYSTAEKHFKTALEMFASLEAKGAKFFRADKVILLNAYGKLLVTTDRKEAAMVMFKEAAMLRKAPSNSTDTSTGSKP